MGFEQINQPDAERNPNTQEKHSTAASLRNGAEKTISLLCKNFSIDGQENLDAVRKIQNEQADSHFVITSSHLSNLDGAGAIKAFGDDFDLQMAVDSTHFGFTPQEVMYRMAGKENFTAVEYKKVKGGKIGVFNPDNFSALTEKSEQGKTPWIALSGLSITGKIQGFVGNVVCYEILYQEFKLSSFAGSIRPLKSDKFSSCHRIILSHTGLVYNGAP